MLFKSVAGKTLSFCIILLLVLFVVSCNQRGRKPQGAVIADEPFPNKLQTLFKPVDTQALRHIRSVAEEIRATYQEAGYAPIWLKASFATNDAAGKLMDELADVRWDGLDTERFHIAALRMLKLKLDTTKVNSLDDAIRFDTSLTRCYLAAARDLLVGTVNPKKADSLWFHVNDTLWNAPQLLANAKSSYPSLDLFRSKVPTYLLLREEYKRFTSLLADSNFNQSLENLDQGLHPDSAMISNIDSLIKAEMPWVVTVPHDSLSQQKQLVFAYQAYKGIQLTGKLDSNTLAHLATPVDSFLYKIRANMERVRWMQQQFGDLYLVVDVPLMELFLRKDGANAMHMRVVVGKPERQTPSLFATMSNVVINPDWGVPPTILKKDVIPGIQKSGKSYLTKKGLKIYDKKGKVVSYSSINARNLKNYDYKQAPGDDNSLGYVKFNLPNPWDIYLHDTPHRDDFGKRFRALSSGCIRLQYPQEMAVYILSDLEKKKYTLGKLDTIIGTHKTKWEVLKTKIPVHIAYLTAFEDTTGKHIRFARDVYHRDDKLISLLNPL